MMSQGPIIDLAGQVNHSSALGGEGYSEDAHSKIEKWNFATAESRSDYVAGARMNHDQDLGMGGPAAARKERALRRVFFGYRVSTDKVSHKSPYLFF